MSASIADVAKRAGVSTATVSRVLADKPHVSKKTRQKVLQAIKELDYRPDRTAQRLRLQTSDVLGLIVSDVQNPYFTSVARGVEDAAYDLQMNVLLCNTDEDPERQKIYLDIMRAERVAGLIIAMASNQNGDNLKEIRQSGIPVVLLDRLVDDFESDCVVVDNIQGTKDAINHFFSLGYRRIGAIHGASRITSAAERQQGYCEAFDALGLESDKSIIKMGNFKRETGYELTLEILKNPNLPEALFIANNQMTLGALQAFREHKIRIPHDIAIISFDDTPWAGELSPPLTAISQPTYELGGEAIRLLQRRITYPSAPYLVSKLRTKLIIRQSCGMLLRHD